MHNGRLIIVEAKGGNSTWGSRIDLKDKRAEQGSKSYMEKVIDNYQKQLEIAKKDVNFSVDDLAKLKATVKALEENYNKGTIDYYGIKQKAKQTIDVNGEPVYGISDSIDVVKFEL